MNSNEGIDPPPIFSRGLVSNSECEVRDGRLFFRANNFDPVDNPKHYNSHPSGVECIQIAEHMNFNVGNAIKYLWRSDNKNGVEDLKKAAWYVAREIERISKQGENQCG